MANGHKWGETNPVMSAAVATATVIAIGDAVWQDNTASNTPKPAADKAWNTDLATTQEDFHDKFLGVALQRSKSGEVAPIRVATEGVFEFDCASATFAIGDLVGMAKQSGNGIESQKVVAVATENLSIGRVAEVATSATKVKVRIFSRTMLGGTQVMA